MYEGLTTGDLEKNKRRGFFFLNERMSINPIKETIVRELHRQARVNFPRRKYVNKYIGETLQADLVVLPVEFAKSNRGYKYLLTLIDTFSKMAFAEALKTKSAHEVAEALEKILSSYKYIRGTKFLVTDEGTEFYNKPVQNVLRKFGIKHYSVHSKIKASIIERYNRTMKEMMWRHFGFTGQYNFIDTYKDIVKTYNNKKHRTIGMAPSKVNLKNQHLLQNTVYKTIKFKPKTDLKLGDHVRISDISGTFRRGYETRWSVAIFRIVKIKPTNPVTFLIKDFWGNTLDKSYYRQELQPVRYKDAYLVEKVLQTRKNGKESKVRFLGFGPEHDMWMATEDVY